MAQPEKSNFLNKLARFVANPTTDWAALDNAATEQKGKAAFAISVKKKIAISVSENLLHCAKYELEPLRLIRPIHPIPNLSAPPMPCW